MLWSGPSPKEAATGTPTGGGGAGRAHRAARRADGRGRGRDPAFVATSAPTSGRVTLAFAGLLDETNRQRSEVIQRIKEPAERQRNLAGLVERLTSELDAAPPGTMRRAPTCRAPRLHVALL